MPVIVTVLICIFLLLVATLIWRIARTRGARQERIREIRRYESTLGAVGFDNGDGGSLGSLDQMFAVEEEENRGEHGPERYRCRLNPLCHGTYYHTEPCPVPPPGKESR